MASEIKYLSLDGLARVVAQIRANFGANLSYSPSTTNGTISLLDDVIDENTSTYGVLSTITIPSASTSQAGLMTTAQVTTLNNLAAEEITGITAGNGLTGGGTKGSITLNVGAGTGISVAADAVNLKTATNAEIGGIKIGYTASEQNYPVQLTSTGQAYVNVPWQNTTSFTITAAANDDDVVILTGTNGSNKVTYTASHAKKLGDGKSYSSNNTKTSISGSGASGTIQIPQLTVDQYGHVTAAADEAVTITMPTIPSAIKNPKALTLTVGNNAAVTYDGDTAKSVEISLATLGIPYVMQYAGQTATTQTLADGSATAAITLTTGSYTAKRGDVVIDSGNSREYIWNGSKWELFGVDNISSYKLKQTAVSDPTASGTANAFIDTISQDANGNITVTKKNVTPLSTTTAVSTATDAIVLGGITVSGHTITAQTKTIVAGSNITVGTSTAGKIYISGTPDTHKTSINVVGTSNIATANGEVTGNGVYLNHTEDGTKTSSHKITGSGSCKVTSDASGNITIYADTNTDTHYNAKNVITSSSTSTTNAAASNPYLNLIENDQVRSSQRITGAGGTTVSSDANGNLTITSETHVAITNAEIDALFA